MKKHFCWSIIPMGMLLLLGLGTAAGAETLNRVVAVVNNDIITSYQLEKNLASVPESQREGAAATILESMVEDLLLEQRAAQIGVTASDEEIDGAISDIQVQNRLTLEQLEQALQAQGQSLADYRDKLRSEILRYKLLGREVKAKADVTTQELRNYYEDHGDDYRLPAMVHLGVLNVAVPEDISQEGRELLQAKGNKLRSQLEESQDFAALLAQVSADPDVSGSDLGAFAAAELSPLYADAVQDLPEGGVSALLDVPNGLVLLKVIARIPGGVRPFDEVRDDIEKLVREKKTQELFDAWKKGLRAEATIDIRL